MLLIMSSNIYLVGVHHKDIDGAERMKFFLDRIKPEIIAIEWDHIRDANMGSLDYPSLEELILQSKQGCEEIEESLRADKEILENLQRDYKSLGLDLSPRQIALETVMTRLIESIIPQYLVSIPKQYVQSHPATELHYIDLPRENVDEISETYETDRVEETKADVAQLGPSEREALLNLLNAGFDSGLEIFRKITEEEYDKEKMNERFRQTREYVLKNGGDAYSQAVYDPEREKYMGQKIRELSLKNQGSLVAFAGLGHLLRLHDEIKDLNPAVLTLAECDSV